MLNREKYGNELMERVVNRGLFGLKDGKPVFCTEIVCKDCDFYEKESDSCKGSMYNFREWFNSEYVEPPVDWIKVPVDTPILVRNIESDAWTRRHFAKYEDNTVYAWNDGATSWSTDSDNVCDWAYAKLAESEDADAR